MSIDPQDFLPPVLRGKSGREYRAMPGRKRKVPREVRAHIYQLMLTVRESEQEIRRILRDHGIDGKGNEVRHKAMIWRDRG